MAKDGQSQLSHIHNLRASSPVPSLPGPALPMQQGAGFTVPECCWQEKWGQLSGMPKPVREGHRFAQLLDIYVVPGGCPEQGCPHGNVGHGHQLSLLHGYRPKDGGLIWLCWLLTAGYFFYPHVFSSISLHNTQTILFLFLPSQSTTYIAGWPVVISTHTILHDGKQVSRYLQSTRVVWG